MKDSSGVCWRLSTPSPRGSQWCWAAAAAAGPPCCTPSPIAWAAPSASTSTSSARPAPRSASAARWPAPRPSPPRCRPTIPPRRARRSIARCACSPARSATRPSTFLLDEILELRTFESFPGLRHVLRETHGRARGERQPLRADQPLRRARPPPAARHRRPLRGHSPAVAVAGRGHRDAAADGRHVGRGSRVRGPHDPGADRRPRRLRPRAWAMRRRR